MFVNGKEVNNDQPVKISRIELVENKVNAGINAQIELKPEPKVAEQKPIDLPVQVTPITPATPATPAAPATPATPATPVTPAKPATPAKPNQKEVQKVKDDAAESSIVTADYIQQSMISHHLHQKFLVKKKRN